MDVAEATANITATVDGKTATIAVNYVSRATLDEQVPLQVLADDEYVVATAQSVKLDRGIARGPHAG